MEWTWTLSVRCPDEVHRIERSHFFGSCHYEYFFFCTGEFWIVVGSATVVYIMTQATIASLAQHPFPFPNCIGEGVFAMVSYKDRPQLC